MERRVVRFLVVLAMGLLAIGIAGCAEEVNLLPDSASSLVASYTVPPGAECDNGGVAIESGIDENGNGVLDASEVDWTEYVCNGIGGADGIDGIDGADGTDNHIVASYYCDGGLAGLPSIRWTYHAQIFAAGDVFASATLYEGSVGISSASYFSVNQVGAQTATVILFLDLFGMSNYGYWTVELNRATLATEITYNDVDYAPNPATWVQPAGDCQAYVW